MKSDSGHPVVGGEQLGKGCGLYPVAEPPKR
jgi:hypothetical protein